MNPLRIAVIAVATAAGLCGIVLLTWYLCVGRERRAATEQHEVAEKLVDTSFVVDAPSVAESLQLTQIFGPPIEPPTSSTGQESHVGTLSPNSSTPGGRGRRLTIVSSDNVISPCSTIPPGSFSFSHRSIKHFDPAYERL
eukprot:TRINITY_DN15514_c0_g1_i1.p1 TRINITY_DN15514_c0_g1~~TRINITY_DN15514_c0_g1_i1.p1  ORF type:complete len:158 (+),score=15.96 TRINITY_DN15514_c0_g1_i1:57-476(+)